MLCAYLPILERIQHVGERHGGTCVARCREGGDVRKASVPQQRSVAGGHAVALVAMLAFSSTDLAICVADWNEERGHRERKQRRAERESGGGMPQNPKGPEKGPKESQKAGNSHKLDAKKLIFFRPLRGLNLGFQSQGSKNQVHSKTGWFGREPFNQVCNPAPQVLSGPSVADRVTVSSACNWCGVVCEGRWIKRAG